MTNWRFYLLIICLSAPGLYAQDTITGHWQTTTTLEAGPYTVDLRLNGTTVTGTVRQSAGPQPGPVQIFEGKADGRKVQFKAKSPDGDRTVTFSGEVSGNVLMLTRTVHVRFWGEKGGAGVFGALGPQIVRMERVVRDSK